MIRKIKTSSEKVIRHSEFLSKAVMGIAMAAAVLSPLPLLAADGYDAQIDATQREIQTYKNEQVRLRDYEEQLVDAMASLNVQLRDVNIQIRANQRKYDSLTKALLSKDQEVQQKSRELGSILRQAYLDNEITPLEMIASSKTVSEYMDYFESRDRLQAEMLKNLEIVKEAKQELLVKRDEVDRVLRDGRAMRDTLELKKNEQDELIRRTRGQQEAYRNLVIERNKNIAELRDEQRGANQSFFVNGKIIAGDPNKGGYPKRLDRAPQDSLVDPWGMYNRECVSYTAWKVHQATGKMPYWGGRGNANEWPTSAETDGIETGNVPKKGAVAIAFIGPYGHSMYVEEVLKNGDIRVSEYNYFIDGTYTERITSAAGLTYIYFEE